jgi:hypothetical protein
VVGVIVSVLLGGLVGLVSRMVRGDIGCDGVATDCDDTEAPDS